MRRKADYAHHINTGPSGFLHLLPPLYYIKKSNILHKIDATVQRDDHKSLSKEVLEASPSKGQLISECLFDFF